MAEGQLFEHHGGSLGRYYYLVLMVTAVFSSVWRSFHVFIAHIVTKIIRTSMI